MNYFSTVKSTCWYLWYIFNTQNRNNYCRTFHSQDKAKPIVK